MTRRPTVAVLHAAGTNRDGEAARAVEMAGGDAHIVPLGRNVSRYHAVVVPGGFSFGDALGAGVLLALEAGEALAEFAATSKPVLGICNGFQALVRAGLLPGPAGLARRATLTNNSNRQFECRWVHLAVEAGSTAGLAEYLPAVIACPVAHGEGRLAVNHAAVVEELAAAGNVLFRYVDAEGAPAEGRYPANPNGSVGDIAGLCNAAGNVWGLMPHPEDHVTPAADPFHRPGRLGLGLFEALVQRASQH